MGGEQVEGRHAVLELLRVARREVLELLVDPRHGDDDELHALARARGVPLRVVSAEELARRARSEVPQGVLARAAPVRSVEVAELCVEPALAALPFLVVLDGVTDPHNLGSILRSASGAGATGIVVARRRSAHLTPAAIKAAAGAVEHLDFALVAGIPAALDALRRAGLWRVGLDAEGAVALEEVTVLTEPVALVLGAEDRGLSTLTRQRCDVLARIPLVGPLESLGVAAAAAVACFAVAERRRPPHRA